jgi:hypothetical protein
MPKDATKNIDRYKIRGGHLNEFEYAQSQKELAEKRPQGDAKLIPGTPPEEAGEGLQPTVKGKANAATKGTKSTKANKAAKGSKKAKLNSTRAATTKQRTTRKGPITKKQSTRKGPTAKKPARKAAKKR